MNQVVVVLPDGTLGGPVVITGISKVGPPGPPGPGIASNIKRITASATPPENPEVNDLWIDLSE